MAGECSVGIIFYHYWAVGRIIFQLLQYRSFDYQSKSSKATYDINVGTQAHWSHFNLQISHLLNGLWLWYQSNHLQQESSLDDRWDCNGMAFEIHPSTDSQHVIFTLNNKFSVLNHSVENKTWEYCSDVPEVHEDIFKLD